MRCGALGELAGGREMRCGVLGELAGGSILGEPRRGGARSRRQSPPSPGAKRRGRPLTSSVSALARSEAEGAPVHVSAESFESKPTALPR